MVRNNNWFFGWDSKKELLSNIKKTYPQKIDETEYNFHCKRSSMKTWNQLWTVWEIEKGGIIHDTIIKLFLIRSYKNRWGYHKIEETELIKEFVCPKYMLKMAPEKNKLWRSNVIKNYKMNN